MKFKLLTLLTLATISLVGCKNKEEVKEDLTPDFQVDVEIVDTMTTLEDKSVYDVKLNYTDKYFKYTASTFKKDLMLLSYGATNSSVNKVNGQKFYTDIGFTTIYTSPEYETVGTIESAQYFVAKKEIDDFTVFAVSFKGHDYGQEWGNNLTLGESGDHAGFMATATKVYNNLHTLISGVHNYKLWISGYSRGGALSNVLSYLLMESQDFSVNEDNLYTYTFAGTRGLTKEHAKPYKNVFNIFNSADILSNFAPQSYGLYRCGTDIDIFDEHLDDYLSSFSPEMKLGEFKASRDSYSNDKEFTQYFLQQLTKENPETYNPEKYPYDLCTREHFYTCQDSVIYLLSHVLGMSGYITILGERFSSMSTTEIVSLISDNGEKLTTLLKEIFDENHVSYEVDALADACRVIVKVLNRYSPLLAKVISNDNASRMIAMHYTETIYILINRL